MTKKKTVTIGIAAYNEENTIKMLIRSLQKQKTSSFVLERIIVMLDGSTDNTASILRNMHNRPNVIIIENKERMGKATRLNELFHINQSDILVIFDADILITDTYLIEKMVKGFNSEKVAIVSSNNQPVRPNTFWGKLWYAGENVWYETRKDVNMGDNLYNNSGCAVALEKKFAKLMNLPKQTIADQQFVYLNAMKMDRTFVFKKDAIVYYLPPSTLHDIKIQYARSIGEEDFLKKYFEKKYMLYTHIPDSFKLKGIFKSLKSDPIYTILSLFLLKLIALMHISQDPLSKKGLWKRTNSTKKQFKLL